MISSIDFLVVLQLIYRRFQINKPQAQTECKDYASTLRLCERNQKSRSLTLKMFMKQYQKIIQLRTAGKSLHNITRNIEAIVAESGITTGLCNIFVRHTSASLLIQENADPDVLVDLEQFFAQLVPEDPRRYIHNAEGPDDMPAHIRSALTHTSEQVPIARGELVLGIWQGIYLWEHRQRSHQREIIIHIIGH